MSGTNNLDTEVPETDSDFLKDLSEYLDVLGNEVRLKILKILDMEMKKPIEKRICTDVRGISSALTEKYDISISFQAVKKHLEQLLTLGFIRKEPAICERGIAARAVMNHVAVPGIFEAIMWNLEMFGKSQFELSDRINELKEIVLEIMEKVPKIMVLGVGADRSRKDPDKGKEFFIKKSCVMIGRVDPVNPDIYDPETDIVLSSEYKAVTRVSKPHAKLTAEDDKWYIEDCDSKGGTYLRGNKLDKYLKMELHHNDIIALSKGEGVVHLLFTLYRNE